MRLISQGWVTAVATSQPSDVGFKVRNEDQLNKKNAKTIQNLLQQEQTLQFHWAESKGREVGD